MAAKNQSSARPFMFILLPEIRLIIYEYILPNPKEEPLHLSLRSNTEYLLAYDLMPTAENMQPSTIALAHTCRAFYEECTLICNRRTAFEISNSQALKAHSSQVNPIYAHSISDFDIQSLERTQDPLEPYHLKDITGLTSFKVLRLSDTYSAYVAGHSSSYYARRRYLERIVRDVELLKTLETIHLHIQMINSDLQQWKDFRRGFRLNGWSFSMRMENEQYLNVDVIELCEGYRSDYLEEVMGLFAINSEEQE